ncbi:BnaC01g10260D [Brassica napus]|uniref:BnaC01g10260D protein n=1 Tax=Brassica napus TaxID=3708 RepID=A0A078HKL2_BRANA|nr:BnaC01g10260D [Brassica napus]
MKNGVVSVLYLTKILSDAKLRRERQALEKNTRTFRIVKTVGSVGALRLQSLLVTVWGPATLVGKAPLAQIWMAATLHAKNNGKKVDNLGIIQIVGMKILNPSVPMALRLFSSSELNMFSYSHSVLMLLVVVYNSLFEEGKKDFETDLISTKGLLPIGRTHARKGAVKLSENSEADFGSIVYVSATLFSSSSQNLYSLSPLPFSPTHSPKLRRRCSHYELPINSTRLPAQTKPSHRHFGVDRHRQKRPSRSSSSFHGRPLRHDVVSRHAQRHSPEPSLPSSIRENYHRALPRPRHRCGNGIAIDDGCESNGR